MVREVTAFAAEDGSIHNSKQAAMEADAALKLKKLDIFNHGTILAVIANASKVVDAIGELAELDAPAALPAEQLVDEPTEESL